MALATPVTNLETVNLNRPVATPGPLPVDGYGFHQVSDEGVDLYGFGRRNGKIVILVQRRGASPIPAVLQEFQNLDVRVILLGMSPQIAGDMLYAYFKHIPQDGVWALWNEATNAGIGYDCPDFVRMSIKIPFAVIGAAGNTMTPSFVSFKDHVPNDGLIGYAGEDRKAWLTYRYRGGEDNPINDSALAGSGIRIVSLGFGAAESRADSGSYRYAHYVWRYYDGRFWAWDEQTEAPVLVDENGAGVMLPPNAPFLAVDLLGDTVFEELEAEMQFFQFETDGRYVGFKEEDDGVMALVSKNDGTAASPILYQAASDRVMPVGFGFPIVAGNTRTDCRNLRSNGSFLEPYKELDGAAFRQVHPPQIFVNRQAIFCRYDSSRV